MEATFSLRATPRKRRAPPPVARGRENTPTPMRPAFDLMAEDATAAGAEDSVAHAAVGDLLAINMTAIIEGCSPAKKGTKLPRTTGQEKRRGRGRKQQPEPEPEPQPEPEAEHADPVWALGRVTYTEGKLSQQLGVFAVGESVQGKFTRKGGKAEWRDAVVEELLDGEKVKLRWADSRETRQLVKHAKAVRGRQMAQVTLELVEPDGPGKLAMLSRFVALLSR